MIRRRAWLLGLAAICHACAGVDPKVFDPRTPLRSRLLPLEMHIIDPNVDPGGEAGAPIVPQLRVLEARYVIKKDFRRNVFEPGDPTWGHLVIRVARRAQAHWGWLVASTMTLYTLNLVGFPIMSQTSDVTLEVEILDAQRIPFARFHGAGHGAEYGALYWGRATPGVVNVEAQGAAGAGDFPGPQMVHAEALRAALDDVKRQLEAETARINSRLREAAR